MDQLFKDRISWWNLRAKRESDPWIIFVLYYFIFDAYLTEESASGVDSQKLDWFINNDNDLKTSFRDSWTSNLVNDTTCLKNMSPIRDMRPGSIKEVVVVDENNIEQVIRAIYQIRCNLFHGSKNYMNLRDSQLVSCAGNFLRTAIGWWVVKTF